MIPKQKKNQARPAIQTSPAPIVLLPSGFRVDGVGRIYVIV
jgi:hypothetical protein